MNDKVFLKQLKYQYHAKYKTVFLYMCFLKEKCQIRFTYPAIYCHAYSKIRVFFRSEANDLALRLARAHTKATDVVVLDQ